MQSAEYADQAERAALNIEFTAVIESLKKKNEGFKEKIPRLCYIIERMLELADSTLAKEGFEVFSINQISTEISRYFERNGHSIWRWVHDYCPSKYKDQSKIHNNLSDVRAAEPREVDSLIGLSTKQRDILNQIENVSSSDLEAIYTFANAVKGRCENAARDKNIILPGHENRDSFRTPHPPFRPTTCLEAAYWWRDTIVPGMIEYFTDFPPQPDEKDKKYASGLWALGSLFPSHRNDKMSLTRTMWISRIKYMKHQSKHGAAVKDEVMTILCENCWDKKQGCPRPDTNPEMVRDFKSPTGFRCGSCGGVKGHKRGLTREQCGDMFLPTSTIAEEFINCIPYFFDMAEECYSENKMPYTGARKTALGVDLSKKA